MKRLSKNTDTPGPLTDEEQLIKYHCEKDHLTFARYFYYHRQGGEKFKVNWHHQWISDAIEDVIRGKIKNLCINVPPGSSKTELVIINFIARGLALNPRSRFLHLSYSDDLAALNSQSARQLLRSEEYQRFWPREISDDTKSKKRWNVMDKGNLAGGVYATSISGQVTGFRAGHMQEKDRPYKFNGAILLDDLNKPEEAYSKAKLHATNRKLQTTIKSRKADTHTPIILIMQRIAEDDPVKYIEDGNIPGKWDYIKVPALIDSHYIYKKVPDQYHSMVDLPDEMDTRFAYWSEKESVDELLAMEKGSSNKEGAKVSRQVFAAQYQQNPVAIGGNLLKGEHFGRYKMLPKLSYRKIYADTAQKTAERNDYSVFECWGKGIDNKIYLLDVIRGKWEGPELRKRAVDFWNKHKIHNIDMEKGQLRKLVVEDKSSGTDLVQSIRLANQIPVEALQRDKDKLTRVMDATPYIEAGYVFIPEEAPFVNDFVAECEAFTADNTHAHDDQVDPLLDAVHDMLSTANKLKLWEAAASVDMLR